MGNKKKTAEELEIARILGQRIEIYRTSVGLSQNEFAAKIGSNQKSVSEWETGQSCVTTKHLIKICQVFGLKLSFFDPAETQIELELTAHSK